MYAVVTVIVMFFPRSHHVWRRNIRGNSVSLLSYLGTSQPHMSSARGRPPPRILVSLMVTHRWKIGVKQKVGIPVVRCSLLMCSQKRDLTNSRMVTTLGMER